MIGLLRLFRRDASGVAAVELALIAPVMLLFVFGAIEASNGMRADRKVTQATSTLADLVSQDRNISNADLALIYASAKTVLYPFVDSDTAAIRITSIVANNTGKTTVAWSEDKAGSEELRLRAHSAGDVIKVPANLVAPNTGIILVEIELVYKSAFAELVSRLNSLVGNARAPSDGWTLSDEFYLKPRRSATITRSAFDP